MRAGALIAFVVGVAVCVAALGPGTGVPEPAPARAAPTSLERLERAVAPRRGVIRRTTGSIGRSAADRAIRATAVNGREPGPLVLAIGCIHGDECAGIGPVRRSHFCRRPDAGDLVVVRNLNPDGLALESRLNARGVDLNRNFSVDWRPIGSPGDPEHSGPRPFSEPETRIARQLIRALRPEVTIWFHQQAEPLVRAWGPSIPAARAYARLAGERFVALPWLDGTAPNWQNARFPGTSSFVVELPDAGAAGAERHGRAISQLAIELMRSGDG